MPRLFPLGPSVIVICGLISTVQAAAAAPSGPLSVARLIAAPMPGGGWTAGVVITLQPKTITYWRTPGEAGVPPTFDFSASTNLARADVAYPVPKRIREGDIDANGYEGQVVFPLQLVLADPGAPATIALKIDYATCERVCVPARADLTLRLPLSADAVNAADVRLLAQAQAQVPSALDAAGAGAAATVTRSDAPDKPSWRVSPRTAGPSDLFAEAAEGFYLTTRRDGDAFLVSVDEHPDGRAVPETLRLTLVSASGAVEFTVPAPP